MQGADEPTEMGMADCRGNGSSGGIVANGRKSTNLTILGDTIQPVDKPPRVRNERFEVAVATSASGRFLPHAPQHHRMLPQGLLNGKD